MIHMVQVLGGSSVRMVKSFVQSNAGDGASSSNTSLTVQFRAQLEKLMATLGQAPSFVKCIKPRDVIAGSNTFDSSKVHPISITIQHVFGSIF
jgi:myosin heavy subunit